MAVTRQYEKQIPTGYTPDQVLYLEGEAAQRNVSVGHIVREAVDAKRKAKR